MLTLPPSVKIWCATTPTDLRRGPDGLSGLVRSQLHADPLSGHVFVFFNRKADWLKVLYWDRDAICVWYRRLERGRFHFPTADATSLELTPDHLPLNRQVGIVARSSVRLSRSTLYDWMAAAMLLGPMVALMRARLLLLRVIHSDDASVPFLEPGRDEAREGHVGVYIGGRDHPSAAAREGAGRPRRCTAWSGPASTWASTRSPSCGKRCRGCLRWEKSQRQSSCWSGSRTGGYCVALVKRLRLLPGRGERPPNNGRGIWPSVDVRMDAPGRDENAAVSS